MFSKTCFQLNGTDMELVNWSISQLVYWSGVGAGFVMNTNNWSISLLVY